MSQRARLVFIGVFACIFVGFGAAWYATFKAAGKSTLTDSSFYGFVRPPGARVPAFSLTDQDGGVATPAAHDGKLAVYAFIYSHCRDTCPVQVQQIRGALDGLGHDVPVIGVSVDPANDTPASARSFLLAQHMTGRMKFLLGTREELAPVWRAFGVAPQREGRDHSASTVIVDGSGRQRVGYPPSILTPVGLERDLRLLEP